MVLLAEAGLIEGTEIREFGFPYPKYADIRLTWNGHEFLDKIISDNVWNNTKSLLEKDNIPHFFKAINIYLEKVILGDEINIESNWDVAFAKDCGKVENL
jgi:hypothetical protein